MENGKWIQQKERLKQLILEKAYQRGHFVLASGQRSDYYIDARKITLDPEGAYLVGNLLFELLQREAMDAVGGLTLGADPIVSSIAVVSFLEKKPIPVFIVRKEIKEHGTQKVIEGIDLKPNQRVILVDDVLTTGGSLIEAAKKIQPLGVKIVKVMCIVDRREKRTPLLESLGCPVECLFSIEEIGKTT
jgi:orotate phosphoribosyltransferase